MSRAERLPSMRRQARPISTPIIVTKMHANQVLILIIGIFTQIMYQSQQPVPQLCVMPPQEQNTRPMAVVPTHHRTPAPTTHATVVIEAQGL